MTRVKLPKEGEGFIPWTDEDIQMYLRFWGEGTRERLGMLLCLYTGQRRSDIVRMGQQHVKDGEISVTQSKGGKRLWIPLHRELKAELEKLPQGQLMFLINRKSGSALSSEGFGNWIRASAKRAGIEDTRGPHGLRKAACRRLIEAGCDGETARAISGHASEKEMKPYIQDVDQRKKARQAMATWEKNEQ